MRVLFTGTLLAIGMGYMFALIYVYTSDAGRDGNPGLSVEDIKISYGGTSEGTRLESALKGPMSAMLSTNDLADIMSWINNGAEKANTNHRSSPSSSKIALTAMTAATPTCRILTDSTTSKPLL